MLKEPICSIIIPTYNSEATISRSIDSILCQTFQNYEIIIMDGVSADQTKFLVADYCNKYPFISWISRADNGIYDAMNKGIVEAKGKWLYFLGSDDYLFNKDVLLNVFNYVADDLHDVVYGNVLFAARKNLYDGAFTFEKLTQKNICHQAIFIKKAVFEKIGNFDISYKTVADWHHNIRWFYNNTIQHQFINITIAEYADGGYSSINKDEKFLRVKNELFLRYGFFKLPLQNLITITTKIVKKHKTQNHYFYFLIYGILLFTLKTKKRLAIF